MDSILHFVKSALYLNMSWAQFTQISMIAIGSSFFIGFAIKSIQRFQVERERKIEDDMKIRELKIQELIEDLSGDN